MSRSYTVTCLRVVSMLFIILCHIVKYYTFIPGSSHVDQFFNVGVQLFLLISGYLYGGKIIDNYKQWFYLRCKKIWLPVSIVTILDVIVMALIGIKTEFLTLFIYLFNLQGLSFLSWNFFGRIGTGIENLDPLWFSTMIMICYLLVPVLQKYKEMGKMNSRTASDYSRILALILLIIIVLSTAGICDLSYIFLFAVGYLFRTVGFKEERTFGRYVIIIGIITIILQAIRIILRIGHQGFQYYPQYVILSHALLGIWIFYFAFYLSKKFPELLSALSANKIVRWLDSNSYYIFLVHGLFCRGRVFNVYLIFNNLLTSTVLFIIMTLVSAAILKRLTQSISKKIP